MVLARIKLHFHFRCFCHLSNMAHKYGINFFRMDTHFVDSVHRIVLRMMLNWFDFGLRVCLYVDHLHRMLVPVVTVCQGGSG